MYSGIGIINIICAIQNKENKKICFWQLVFGAYYLYTSFDLGIVVLFSDFDEHIIEWISRIIFCIVPIILAIINLIRIRKNRTKVIQVIAYIAVIILSILNLLEIIGRYWHIIAVVMQLIHIHYQEKNIEESKSRKVINIILYYIIQFCIPIEKNYKYGFINEKGQEKIPCEYDRVSYFNEVEINNSKFYVALAKKGTKFYILSKSNDVLVIDDDLEKYLQTIYEFFGEKITEIMNENGDYRQGYVHAFEFFFQVINEQKEIKTTPQTLAMNNDTKEIYLTERNSKYYYNNQNYSMLIEPIYDDSEEEDYYNNYDDDYYDDIEEEMYTYEPKYKVTVSKHNGEIQSSIVFLPGMYEDESILETFTNGYIEFENEDGTRKGWYDYNGNQVSISSKFMVKDIKDDKVILQVNNNFDDDNYDENLKPELDFIIIDMTGKTLLRTTALDIYDNMYLVKNNNKKMVLLDKDLNVITNEYDKIITTTQIDISANYSSYY